MPLHPSATRKIFSVLNRLEEIVLCSSLGLMVILGVLLIISRNVLSLSLFWIDPILRHLVLWVALLGASVATKEDRHISIDLCSQRLSPKNRAWIQGGLQLFSAIICFLLVTPGIRFVQQEYQTGKPLALGLPVWVAQSIIPVMLIILGLRFLGKAWMFLKRAISEPVSIDISEI